MTASFISVDQLEEGHALVLGTTGSGKTYQLRGMLEQLRRADRRVGAVDKLGNHWGLTLDRDGKAGLDFVIFGGKRAMVPMTPDQGEAIGRLFVERHIPAIFDISQWDAEDQEQWIAAFAQTVFRLNEGALHLSIDEAQSFVPTNGGGVAYKAVRLLAEQGRGNGLRLLLACQRLSRLDSTVREMMHTVVVMRQTGPIDRRAVKDLISADREQGELIERELPKLPVGTGFVWQAGGVDLRRIRFGENATFDSSRTPRHGDNPPPPIASTSALVDELRTALAPVEEAPHPDDVIPTDAAEAYAKGSTVGTLLRERDDRIAELEEQLALADARLADAARANAECADMISDSITRELDLADLLQKALDRLHWPKASERAESAVAALQPEAEALPAPVRARPPVGHTDPRLGAERRPLASLAGFYPAGLTDAQWATIAGFKRTGGTWTTYRSRLRTAGLIEQIDGRWRATAAGVAAIGGEVAEVPPPGPALVKFWADRITGAGKMLLHLGRLYPKALKRDALAAELNMAAGGGTFGTYLSRLRGNGLLEEKAGRIRLAPALMGDEL